MSKKIEDFYIKALEAENERLKAENERLEEALADIFGAAVAQSELKENNDDT